MPKALLCEKWELPITDGKTGFFKHTNVSELSRRAKCFEWLVQDIPFGKTVIEYFGGIGLQSVIIEETINPLFHDIYDIDEDCVEQLKIVFKDKPVTVALKDAKEAMGATNSDIAILDFPNMTAKHYEEWDEPLGRLFRSKPKLVEITDVGNRYLHLHRPLYSEILGQTVTTIEDYISAISKFLYQKYDYSVVKAAYKSGTSYMFLGNVSPETIEFKYVGPDKSGFRYIE